MFPLQLLNMYIRQHARLDVCCLRFRQQIRSYWDLKGSDGRITNNGDDSITVVERSSEVFYIPEKVTDTPGL